MAFECVRRCIERRVVAPGIDCDQLQLAPVVSRRLEQEALDVRVRNFSRIAAVVEQKCLACCSPGCVWDFLITRWPWPWHRRRLVGPGRRPGSAAAYKHGPENRRRDTLVESPDACPH